MKMIYSVVAITKSNLKHPVVAVRCFEFLICLCETRQRRLPLTEAKVSIYRAPMLDWGRYRAHHGFWVIPIGILAFFTAESLLYFLCIFIYHSFEDFMPFMRSEQYIYSHVHSLLQTNRLRVTTVVFSNQHTRNPTPSCVLELTSMGTAMVIADYFGISTKIDWEFDSIRFISSHFRPRWDVLYCIRLT